MCSVLLTDLLSALPPEARRTCRIEAGVNDAADTLRIEGITQDSRQVRPGWLFAAIPGHTYNGEDYIEVAIQSGACLILCREQAAALAGKSAILICEEPRRLLSQLAAAFYQPQPPYVVAVTGTDGKTSTAEFTRQLWELMGYPSLSIGTLGLKSSTVLADMPLLSDNTSPEPVSFYRALSTACLQQVYHVVCEASSHGLDQYRLEGIEPQAAIFTSFSQDHLDYHGSMDTYFAAKKRLFTELLAAHGTAILCSDYPEIQQLANVLKTAGTKTITYGIAGDIIIRGITPIPSGQQVQLHYDRQDYSFNLPIFGSFQVYNVLAAALAITATLQCHLLEVIPLFEKLHPIRGRLELAGQTAQGALIFVDYAHTPAALEKALQTLRPYASHQLHVIFGCGGDRDKGKRPLMGAVAQQQADRIIVTDDNPRTEEAASIRRAVLAGCPDAREIADRRQAIREGITSLRKGDVLLIAGKGHEDYQIIGTVKHHSDDVEIARQLLGERMMQHE